MTDNDPGIENLARHYQFELHANNQNIFEDKHKQSGFTSTDILSKASNRYMMLSEPLGKKEANSKSVTFTEPNLQPVFGQVLPDGSGHRGPTKPSARSSKKSSLRKLS